MSTFNIEMTYLASITVTVEANNEGEALDKARNIAEDADLNEYQIGEERETRVLNTN